MTRVRSVKLPSVLYMFVLFEVLNGVIAADFCQQVVKPFGYGCAEYTIQTEDGFLLAMHRLSRINSLGERGRASSPVVSMSPAAAPAPLQGGPIVSQYPEASSPSPVKEGPVVSQYPEASGPSPSWMVVPSDGNISSINDSTVLLAVSSSGILAHITPRMPAPEVFGNRNTNVRNTNVRHSNSANATHKGKHPHHQRPGGSTPSTPITSVSSNRTSATHKGKRPHHWSPGRSSPGAPTTLVSANRTSSNNSSEHPVVMAGLAPTSTQNASSSSTHRQRQSTGCTSNYTAKPLAGKGSPVLLMHQELFNGDIWFEFVDAAENCSRSLLPIKLLNDGFDVWIGHQRATYWSHGHVQLNSTDREYWDWTWDQHVQYDLSIQLLFISTETNQPVHFIGSSQAATVGVAAATDHEVAQIIRSLTLIGPTAYRGYSNSLLLEAWAYDFGLTIDSEYYVTGYQNGAFNYSMEFPQTGPFSARGLSNTAIALISGPNCCLDSAAPIQFTNGWDGTTSFKNLLHWQQGIRTNNFAHYDYGNPARNMQAYGQATPPAYNVGQIPRRLPILIIAGGRDWFTPPQGIRLLLSQLQATFVNLTNYAHYDLLFSVQREADIYLPILQYLEGSQFQ